jgi:hypothetical protein
MQNKMKHIKLFEQFINERIKASDAYDTKNGVQTVIDGKRDLAFISTMDNPIYRPNNEKELAAMEYGLENGLKAIEVKGKKEGRAWVMYKKNKKAAQKLADYAESKEGYLSDDTPEEAKYVGDLLGYDKKDIKDFIKRVYKVDEDEDRADLKDEDKTLMKIRHFQGSVQDLDDWLRSKIGETNPYKDTIMINGPHQGEKDKSLPYQDFQNGESDLVKNRHGRKDS